MSSAAPRVAHGNNFSQEDRRKAFGVALRDALAGRGLQQAYLAESLGTTQSTISAWINGRAEPDAFTVFAVEDCLDLSPGFLSRLLGYLPLNAVNAPASVEQSVAVSDEVDEDSKRMVLAVWRTLVAKHKDFLRLSNGSAPARKAKAPRRAAPQPTPLRSR